MLFTQVGLYGAILVTDLSWPIASHNCWDSIIVRVFLSCLLSMYWALNCDACHAAYKHRQSNEATGPWLSAQLHNVIHLNLANKSQHMTMTQDIIELNSQWSLWSLVLSLCTTMFNVKQFTLCPQSLRKKTAIIFLCWINWLVFITEMECVYCAVRTESLNTVYNNNNHGSTALLWARAPSFRGYWVVRIRGSWWLGNWPRCCSIDPDVTARAIWQAVRRLGWEMAAEFCLRNISIHARKVLSPLKIHRPRPGSNPRTLGPVASTLTTSPPRST